MRRIAVTGIGVVTSTGVGAPAMWESLAAGRSGISSIEHFDASEYTTTFAGYVRDFDPSAVLDSKDQRRMSRFQQFAMVAADEALRDAGLTDIDEELAPRAGCIVGSGIGGIGLMEEQVKLLNERGPGRISPFLVPMMIANAAGAAVSMRYGLQGPSENSVTACAAGTHSISNAARLIANGRCDLMLAGAAEAAITPLSLATFGNMTALSTSGRSCPFDVERDGFVMSEGAAVLVLERWDAAVDRNATILAEVLGSGSTADAHHITSPSPGGDGALRAMQVALDDASLTATDIAQINAHGTSTPLNDLAETTAIATLFGTPGPPVTSIKGVTGHSLGAAGAFEAVATVLSFQHRLVPPTMGTRRIDPALPDLQYVVGEPLAWEPGPTMSNSFGFGGHNGCVILGPA